jgi:hypothetical protein
VAAVLDPGDLLDPFDEANVLNTQRWDTREVLLAIVTWIETKYHRKRRQRGLGKLTSLELRPFTCR